MKTYLTLHSVCVIMTSTFYLVCFVCFSLCFGIGFISDFLLQVKSLQVQIQEHLRKLTGNVVNEPEQVASDSNQTEVPSSVTVSGEVSNMTDSGQFTGQYDELEYMQMAYLQIGALKTLAVLASGGKLLESLLVPKLSQSKKEGKKEMADSKEEVRAFHFLFYLVFLT